MDIKNTNKITQTQENWTKMVPLQIAEIKSLNLNT